MRRRIALGKEVFNKKRDLMQKSLSFICEKVRWKYLSRVLCCMEVKRGLQKEDYSATWGIWNVDMEAYAESTVEWAQNKRGSIANSWHRKINDGHSQKSTELVRSYPQTWFITENNVRMTNTRGKGCGRPRKIFVDWLLKTEEDNINMMN